MHILTDASSLIMSYELVKGIQRPGALNIFELARLIEAIVLHEKITILDTSPLGSIEEQQLRIARQEIVGDSVSMRKMSPHEIVTSYVNRTFSSFSADIKKSEYTDRYDNDRRYDGVVRLLKHLLLAADTGQMEKYADFLQGVWKIPEAKARKPKSLFDIFKPSRELKTTLQDDPTNPQDAWRRLTQKRAERGNWFFGGYGPENGTVCDAFENQSEIFDVYCRVYEACDPSGGSAFAQWRNSNRGRYSEFAQSMFSRTNLYILAGELIGAPYRPGALRWPICWHHFTKRHLGESSIGEAFVRLAERLEVEQRKRFKKLVGNGTVSFSIPLLLRAVMKECSTPDELFKKAYLLRSSGDAKRFRALSQELTREVNEGRLVDTIRALDDCAKSMSKAFGLSDSPANWTLLSAPSISLTPYGSYDVSGSVRATGSTFLELGTMVQNWWKNRRFALVVRAANYAATGKMLSAEVERLFRHPFTEKELGLMTQFDDFAPEEPEDN